MTACLSWQPFHGLLGADQVAAPSVEKATIGRAQSFELTFWLTTATSPGRNGLAEMSGSVPDSARTSRSSAGGVGGGGGVGDAGDVGVGLGVGLGVGEGVGDGVGLGVGDGVAVGLGLGGLPAAVAPATAIVEFEFADTIVTADRQPMYDQTTIAEATEISRIDRPSRRCHRRVMREPLSSRAFPLLGMHPIGRHSAEQCQVEVRMDPDVTRRDVAWLESLPKVELHLHIEGAIPHDALWELIRKYGGDPRVPTLESLPGQFVYRDFPDFIDRWIWKHGFIREPADFELIGRAVASELARQRIVYAEAFFTPSDVARTGMTPQQVALALRRGIAAVPQVEIGLISDVCRDVGPEVAARNLEKIGEVAAEAGVVGIGMGGSEQLFPPEPFAGVYTRARDLGLRLTAHAGEVAGPESVWGALRALGVERIDHGTRAVDDPALMEWLASHRVPVTSCPGSNVATGAVPSLAAHPIRAFLDAGLVVSVATDDPAMFGLSMAGEFAALMIRRGFTRADIRTLSLNAVESTWLPAERRAALRARLESDPAWAAES